MFPLAWHCFDVFKFDKMLMSGDVLCQFSVMLIHNDITVKNESRPEVIKLFARSLN